VNDTSPLLVVCLCAQWCGTCRDYVATFEAAAPAFGAAIQWRWIDIEDEAALLDGVDVEDFPTLLIARDDRVLFFGTITPQPQTLARLLASALAGELPRVAPDADLDALVRHLNANRLRA